MSARSALATGTGRRSARSWTRFSGHSRWRSGDGAASRSGPNAEEDYIVAEALWLEDKFNSQEGRPAEGSEPVQPLVRVGRFGNVLVRQQLAELSSRALSWLAALV